MSVSRWTYFLLGFIASWHCGSGNSQTAPPPTPKPSDVFCPVGWTPMDGQFCMWKSLDSLPWGDALASCRQNLSHLLILHDKYYDSNEAQSSIIFSNIRNLALDPPELSDMWVGIHVIEDPRRNVTKLWWEADVPLPVRRTDKDKVTLFDWTPGQPNLKRGRCGAVFYVSKYATPGPSTYDYSGSTGVSQPTNSPPMERFSVTLVNCSESRKFICVREATPIVIKSNFTDDQCPSDWYGSEYLDTCYKGFNFQKTFSEANAACEGTKGGSLALPYDNTTMRFILKVFEEHAASSGAYDFWTGIYYNNKTTVNGKVWRQNISAENCYSSGRPMADLANSSCLYMKVDGSGQERWCYGNCNYNRTFICQINASPPDPPKASVESKNLSVSVKNCSSQIITCNASNYHPCKPVIWIKDGFYIDNGYPPQGLTLTLDQNLLDKLPGTAVGSLQGEYRCEVWGQRSEFRRSSDDSAGLDRTLVIFEDTATFRGTVSYDKSKWEPALNASVVEANSLLYWTASDYRKINSSVSEIFGELPGLEIQLEDMKLGSVQVSCSLYYNYTIADEQALQALTGYLESSDSGTTWQRTLNDRVYQLLSRRAKASIWSTSLPSTGINWINLTSIDACSETTINGLTFRFTEFGNQANSTQLCPFDTGPKAIAICQGDFISGGIWTLMSSVPCSTYRGPSSSSTPGLQQLAQTVINRTNVDDVIASAAQLTSSPEELTSTDVIYATEVLNNIATRQDIPKSVAVNFLKTVSNIAAVNETELQGAGKAARAIISAVDQFTDNVNLEESSNLVVSESSVALQVWETGLSQDVFGFGSYETDSTPRRETYFSVMGDDDLTNQTLEAAIVLSQEAINIGRRQQILLRSALNWNENLRLSFILYMDGAFFSNPAYVRIDSWKNVDTQNISLNSYVISASINGRKIANLTDPVKIVFKQTRVPNRNWNYGNYSPRCVYWENDEKTGTWGWSTNGVWTPSSYDDQSVLGFSRHLTNFAIIAGFSGNPDTPIAIALKTLSIIGISISIAGLGLTILAQILFRALAKGRSQMVLLNLSVALLAVNILVLVGVDRTDNYNGCIAVAALLLYFLLASFCWMLVEGVVQYLKFVKVFDTYTPRFMLKVSLPAWGLPLIPVILVAAIDHTQFRGPDNYCWLKPHAFHFAFLLPLALIWMTNLIMFVLIIKGITCDRPKGLQSTQKRSRLVMLQVQAAACCCIVMGLTWLFCLLSVDGSVIAMDFLFCIFNSLQGFFIFLFLNVREKPVRQAWKSFFLKCCATCRREQRSKKSFNYVQKQSKTSISDSQESSWDSGFSHSTAASSSQKSTSDMELSPAEAELSGIETIIRKTSYYYDLDNKDCNMMY